MKTKLLKKVRRRFEITHMPDGFFAVGHHYKYNLLKLEDNTNPYWSALVQINDSRFTGEYGCARFDTVEEGVVALKSIIILCLKQQGHLGRKEKNAQKNVQLKTKKIWYV